MKLENYKYTSFLTEINSSTVPLILVILTEEKPKIIHYNDPFEALNDYGVTSERLNKNIDFVKFCLELLNSETNSQDNEQIKLGRRKRVVELYGTSKSLDNNLLVNRDNWVRQSDLLIIHVNIQELVNTAETFSTPQQNKLIYEQVSKEIDRVYAEIEDLNKEISGYKKELETHLLYQMTKDLTLGRFISILSAVIMIFSTLNLGEEPLIDTTNDIVNQIKKIVD